MKILFLSHQYPPETAFGGIGSYTATISRALVARGHEVHVLTCWHGVRPDDHVEDGVHVHRRRTIGLGRLQRVLWLPGVRDLVARVRMPSDQESANPLWRIKIAVTCWIELHRLGLDVDVIEAPDFMAESLAIALTRSHPVVVDFKGNILTYSDHSGYRLSWQGRLASRMERAAVARADTTTTPSRLTVEALVAAGWRGAADATLIPRPVDTRSWADIPPITEGPPLLLQVGRVEPIKAPDILIRAVAQLPEGVPRPEIAFVGVPYGEFEGTPAGDFIPALAQRLGVRCRFEGRVAWSDMPAWYERARVVTVASRFDNFPNTALEGMAAGRPVVTSTRSGAAELGEDRDRGLAVVDPESPAELAAALQPYLEDAGFARDAGERARRFVEECCGPASVAARREQVYAEAIRQWRNGARRSRPSARSTPA